MSLLPESLFADPVWSALDGPHRRFRMGADLACRYPGDVTPFASVGSGSVEAMAELRSLMKMGEAIWVPGTTKLPDVDGLRVERSVECLQMVLPEEVEPMAAGSVEIVELSCEHAGEMMALIAVAFPVFFRVRTCEMGSYFGLRMDGSLVGMGGERMVIEGWPEISGVCTHPEHRGKGYAEAVIWHLVRMHRAQGVRSWLHVASENAKAIGLYRRMGFLEGRRILIWRVRRISDER